MTSIFSRWLPKTEEIEPIPPGFYHHQASEDSPIPYRMHLRVEPDGNGVLIVNAATVLHLNPTATAHALHLVRDATPEEAAQAIADRYRVGRRKARQDYATLRDQILTLATNPDVDPVIFLGLDRAEPLEIAPSAPYRLDLALTYACDPDGELDALARERVDRQLDTEDWKKVLSKIWEAGIPHVTFTGGEPTRRPDLVELVRYAEELGLVTGVLTQGRRLADSQYVNDLAMAGLDHFLIVLAPDVSETLAGIQNALASDVFTAVHLTLAGSLAEDPGAWLEKLQGMGVEAVSLSAPDASPASASLLAETREQADDLGLSLIWDLPVPYSDINPISLELEVVPPGAGSAWLYVEPDADVLPGQGVNHVIGNLLRDAWETVWEKARQKDW